MKILSVFGTRPEAIKMAPIIKGLEQHPEEFVSRICVTSQHRQMLDQVLNIFAIVPDYDLNVMQDNQSPSQVASAILAGLGKILDVERPDWVLVQGDTTTVLATSIAAFYARTMVAHVEAGLRTGDKLQPFPEEINRRMMSVVADLHFAPTQCARHNLLREGVDDNRVVVTGNTVVDAMHWILRQPIQKNISQLAEVDVGGLLREVGDSKLILVTAHRRENLGKPMQNICLALRDIALQAEGQVRIIFPVHLNPNVWVPVHDLLKDVPAIILTPPLDYPSLIYLMKHAYLILTDSGGIQEEAPTLKVPVLVLREKTERTEAVEAGMAKIVGSNRDRIVGETLRLVRSSADRGRMTSGINPFGDGQAAERIIAAFLGKSVKPCLGM